MVFVKVAELADLPEGRGTFIEAGTVQIALFNTGGGRVVALGAVCPHEDGPLAEGWLENGTVVCPWHGFDFDVTTGRCGVDADLGIPVYPVRITGSTVEVDLP